MLNLGIEPPEGCSITTADNPGHSFPCATIHRFDDPLESDVVCNLWPWVSSSSSEKKLNHSS